MCGDSILIDFSHHYQILKNHHKKLNMKIGYKYTQSNIFTVSAAYLCHISFQTKRLQKKRFIRRWLMNIFLFSKQLFKVGLVIVSWHLNKVFMHFLFVFSRLTEICFLVNQSITIFEISIIHQWQVKFIKRICRRIIAIVFAWKNKQLTNISKRYNLLIFKNVESII